MIGKRTGAVALALAAVLAWGCSSAPSEGGPEQTVREFYGLLNDGDYAKAMSLYTKEARSVLEDPDSGSESSFAAWAREQTKQGKLDRIEVLEQTPTADGTTVEFKILYEDGTSKRASVKLIQEDGQWRLGLVG